METSFLLISFYASYAGTTPVEIDLQVVEGSPEAFEVVFNILHFKRYLISHNILSYLLYQIAKVGNIFHLNKTLNIVWMSNQKVAKKKKLCLILLFSNWKRFKKEYINMILSGERGSGETKRKNEIEEYCYGVANTVGFRAN